MVVIIFNLFSLHLIYKAGYKYIPNKKKKKVALENLEALYSYYHFALQA